jgi:uncharacterized protein YcgI (DUF1989 family)
MIHVPCGTATRLDLDAGDSLQITVAEGHQPGDLSFPGFDQALTRDVNGLTAIGRPVLPYHATEGMVLVDGEGDPVLEVGPVTGGGGNDIMLPGCRKEIYADGRPGCRDLVSAALGIPRAQLTGMLSFFAVGRAHEAWFDGLAGTSAGPDASCRFTAVRPCAVAVSACPGVDIPGYSPGALGLTIVTGD